MATIPTPGNPNVYARFRGASVEHLLRQDSTLRTYCGADARYANRYPHLTRANSADRRVFPRCERCRAAQSQEA